MAPRRSSTLKLRNGETNESMMMFEVVAPAGSVTPIHLHHEGDEGDDNRVMRELGNGSHPAHRTP